jgi:hypothetical protein
MSPSGLRARARFFVRICRASVRDAGGVAQRNTTPERRTHSGLHYFQTGEMRREPNGMREAVVDPISHRLKQQKTGCFRAVSALKCMPKRRTPCRRKRPVIERSKEMPVFQTVARCCTKTTNGNNDDDNDDNNNGSVRFGRSRPNARPALAEPYCAGGAGTAAASHSQSSSASARAVSIVDKCSMNHCGSNATAVRPVPMSPCMTCPAT